MKRRTRFFAFAGFCSLPVTAWALVPVLASSACTSSSSSADGGSVSGTDSGTTPSPEAGGSTGTLAVAPTSANVLTCSTLQLTETGGKGGGTWSVAPSTGLGTISATGSYSAPTVSPSQDGGTTPATITYAEGAASASAALSIATAFPSASHTVPITAGDVLSGAPFEHQFAANGSHVYGAFLASVNGAENQVNIDVFASTDNGATFGAPTSYHAGNLTCATLAVDAADPSTVYLAYYGGHGDSTSNTGGTLRLAVSTDGAKTFPTEYVIGDSDNSIVGFICPDVVSPSANQVIVAGVVSDDTSSHVGTFISGNKGANIGPVGTVLTATPASSDGGVYAPTDTNWASANTCVIDSNSGSSGPRVVSNGKGAACLVYQYDFGCTLTGNVMAQCSQDNGTTWSAPVALGIAKADTGFYPTGAVSPSGKLAVTWDNALTTDAGTSDIGTYVAISSDHGKTFAAPVLYPLALQNATGGTSNPVVAWENDQVLWLSRTGNIANFPSVSIDKTCDDGATWSGPLVVADYQVSSLVLTSTGMAVAAFDSHNHATYMYSLAAP